MAGSRGNVVPLPGPAGEDSGKVPHAEILWTVVGHLDQLGMRLRRRSGVVARYAILLDELEC